ncbi:hypothetical protein C0993_005532 [Termitomyces sp. T159_Od127]|nr:hypothetical protein C0993_005532 [Termitomyces sp. T159_Od127]
MTLGAAAILKDVDVLLFDVFGTVVDWRSTVERELRALLALHDLKTRLRHVKTMPSFLEIVEEKWEADFAQEWRTGYLETTSAPSKPVPGFGNLCH